MLSCDSNECKTGASTSARNTHTHMHTHIRTQTHMCMCIHIHLPGMLWGIDRGDCSEDDKNEGEVAEMYGLRVDIDSSSCDTPPAVRPKTSQVKCTNTGRSALPLTTETRHHSRQPVDRPNPCLRHQGRSLQGEAVYHPLCVSG